MTVDRRLAPRQLARIVLLTAGVILAAASGCKTKSKTSSTAAADAGAATPRTYDCAGALSGAMDRMVAETREFLAQVSPGQRAAGESQLKEMQPMLDQMKARIIQACTEDTWSPEMLACLGAAKVLKDVGQCGRLLTPTQKTNLHRSDDPGVPTVWNRMGIY